MGRNCKNLLFEQVHIYIKTRKPDQVKNMFYEILKKGVTTLNYYISHFNLSNYKKFELKIISCLNNMVEHSIDLKN
jgi:hypothetical protein